MFTLAIRNKNLSPAAAVYVAETKSWKLVKNFCEEPTAYAFGSTRLEVVSSIVHLDISPAELGTLLTSIQTGVDLLCDYIVKTNPTAESYKHAVSAAVRDMFGGFRCSQAYTGTDAQTIQSTHGGTDYIWNPNTDTWQFRATDGTPDGTTKTINGSKNYHLDDIQLTTMVSAYLDVFPLNSSGSFGVVYTMACC